MIALLSSFTTKPIWPNASSDVVHAPGSGIGGTGVDVGGTAVAAGAPHPVKVNTTTVTATICCSNFWRFIFHSFLRGNVCSTPVLTGWLLKRPAKKPVIVQNHVRL
jgi:hypothetical protein